MLAALGALLAVAACAPLARDPARRYVAPERPPLVQVTTEEAVVVDGHVEEVVRLRDADGMAVTLLVKRPAPPAGAAAAPAPVVVILGGLQTGREAARLVPATRGLVVAALSYPYHGARTPAGLVGTVRMAAHVRRASLETPLAVRLALDWLLAQPWADPTRVEAVGASLGVPYMTVATATDARIGRLWLVHGGGRSRTMLAHAVRGTVPTPPLRTAVAAAADALLGGPRLTPERWVGQVAPRPVVQVDAAHDERIPPVAADALWAATRAPRERVRTAGAHLHPRRPELVRAVLDSVLVRMVGGADGASTRAP